MQPDYYVLCGPGEQFHGIFSTPQEAMRHVYLMYVYHIMRGYSRTIPELVWENSGGLHWYGRTPEEHVKEWRFRKAPIFHIQHATVDWMSPLPEDWAANFGEDKNSEHPAFDEWLQVYDRA